MTATVTLTKAEEAQIVAAVVAAVPAAALLKSLHLEGGQVRAGLDTPAGRLDAILEVQITGG